MAKNKNDITKILKGLRDELNVVRDWAIENNKPDSDATVEEKVAYELMKSTRNYDELRELYVTTSEKKLMTESLLEDIYNIVKPANDLSDSVIQKLKNQLDGE